MEECEKTTSKVNDRQNELSHSPTQLSSSLSKLSLDVQNLPSNEMKIDSPSKVLSSVKKKILNAQHLDDSISYHSIVQEAEIIGIRNEVSVNFVGSTIFQCLNNLNNINSASGGTVDTHLSKSKNISSELDK